MPTPDWYATWIVGHCTATGTTEPTLTAVVLMFQENRELVMRDPWYATEEELGNCTRRIVASCLQLRFANEHLPAVGNELIALRAERQATTAQARREVAAGSDCRLCSNSGWVSVPHPKCVWNGRLMLHPDNNRVCTVAVTCDDCPAGQSARDGEADRANRARDTKHPRRPTMGEYTRRISGHDGAAMLAAHQREQSADGRKDGIGSDWPNLIGNLLRRAKANTPNDEAA